jgi:hypothetical protein
MARHKDPARVSAILFDVLTGPTESAGNVLDVLWMADAGREPVVGDDDDKPALGEIARDGAVAEQAKNIVLASRDPTAAVQQEQYREVVLPLGR